MVDEKLLACENFLKSLKVGINHAATYFKGHPMMTRSIDDLKSKLNPVFSFSDTLTIGVTANTLVINGIASDVKNKLYNDLAVMFHRRKIRKIEIQKDVSANELVSFLLTVALSPQEIAKRGGLNELMPMGGDSHIMLEGLDYFELLQEGGEGEKDVWSYLIAKAAQNTKSREFTEFSDNFSRIVDKFKGRDFLENAELSDHFQKFIDTVKTIDHDKFSRCAKELARIILKDRTLSHNDKVGEFNKFFKDLDVLDLSNTLWDQIIHDDNFDFLTFKVFSHFVDRDKHSMIASSMAEQAKNDDILHNNAQLARRMRELFAGAPDDNILRIYKKSLEGFLESAFSTEGDILLDRKHAYCNYRYALLNLFTLEARPSALRPVLNKIVVEWSRIVEDGDIKFIRSLLEVLDKKKRLDPSLAAIFASDEKMIFDHIENKVLDEEDLQYFDLFYDISEKSAANHDLYITRIFHNAKVNPPILKLYFKFFESDLGLFIAEVKKRNKDTDFLKRIIDSIKKIELPAALKVLEAIFYMGVPEIKLEAARAMQYMQHTGFFNINFVLSNLLSSDMYLRKELLLIALPDDGARDKLASRLLGIFNPFWFKNDLILENIKLCGDFKIGSAVPALKAIAGDKRFFHKELAKMADEVLTKWK